MLYSIEFGNKKMRDKSNFEGCIFRYGLYLLLNI